MTQIQYAQFAEKKKIQQSKCQIVKQNLRKENTLLERDNKNKRKGQMQIALRRKDSSNNTKE